MKTKLKTLKDFERAWEGISIFDLKKEAIKWVKELIKDGNSLGFKEGKIYAKNVVISGESNHGEFFTLANWIKHFFNISEEDLKGGIN